MKKLFPKIWSVLLSLASIWIQSNCRLLPCTVLSKKVKLKLKHVIWYCMCSLYLISKDNYISAYCLDSLMGKRKQKVRWCSVDTGIAWSTGEQVSARVYRNRLVFQYCTVISFLRQLMIFLSIMRADKVTPYISVY